MVSKAPQREEKSFELFGIPMGDGTVSFCGTCGASVPVGANFCSSCGAALTQRSKTGTLGALSRGKLMTLICGALILFGGSLGLQSYLEKRTGLLRPTEIYQPPSNPGSLPPGHPGGSTSNTTAAESGDVAESEEIKALRSAMEADPDNIEKMRMFAAALGDYLRESPQSSPRLALDAVDVLSRILQKVPDDAEALVMMADVSFDQRAFTKAQDFYHRYLKLKPTDHGARARFASTLTFLGKFDESISELDSIIQQDPKNFPAMAYLAITYAQKGDVVRAKEVAASALDVAPSQEAKARFSSFVASLDTEGQSPKAENERGGAPSNVPNGPEGELVLAVKNNPIAGQKFVKSEVKGGTEVLLYFKDFPMQAMPPFAKEKFFNGLKGKAESARRSGVRKITFIDVTTGTEMDSITLSD